MEETTYNYIKEDNIKCISLSYILLDRGMKKKVDELCPEKAKKHKLKVLKNDKSFDLKNEKLNTLESKDIFEPIKIKGYKNTQYYEIIDGRHRYVYSLQNDYTSIPCIIIDEK